jgi:hypothetical protein
MCENPECQTPFCTGCGYSTVNQENPRWLDNGIQFPRLLAEISAAGLTEWQYRFLEVSMDLRRQEIDQLLDRAEMEWQRIKNETL